MLATASQYLLLALQDGRDGEKERGAAGYLVMMWCRWVEERGRRVLSLSLLPCISWGCTSGFCFPGSLAAWLSGVEALLKLGLGYQGRRRSPARTRKNHVSILSS